MNSGNEIEIAGITVKNTSNGFIINLEGSFYKQIGDNVMNGKKTKEFYHQLKLFVKSLKELEN